MRLSALLALSLTLSTAAPCSLRFLLRRGVHGPPL